MAAQRIRLLDELTINQIAAGEVIENPASVVKELVENALDSGASAISIETKGGGRGLIRVADDGCGMGPEDLIFSLERHATSKLTGLEDLNSLGTLGFRGEALPSIASVSKLSIHSATEVDEGKILFAEGGRILNVQPKPRRRGTTVEVKSLFFNVPVRKKFQKGVGWDTAEIHKILTKMALCHQKVGFSWISEEREQLSGQSIAELLGPSFMEGMLLVEHRKGSLHLNGYCSQPSLHRPNRTGQYLFINNRPVLSPFVSQKILEGYGTRLSTHRFPLFVLHFSLPPSWIDVNVHPQKKEVRLREEEELGPFLIEAIERVFAPKKQPALSLPPSFMVAEPVVPYAPQVAKEEEPTLFPIRRKVTTRVGRYLFLEEEGGIRVVDGGAARVRVAYEHLLKDEKRKAVQQLLIPIQFEVAVAEKTLLIHNQHLFETLGFSLRFFGGNTFLIDAIPAFFESEEILPFVHAFLEEGDLPKERKIAGALRKTLSLSGRVGGEALVDSLFKCSEPDVAPDGRPTHYLLTEKELAKFFR